MIFWVVASCSPLITHGRFEGTYSVHLQGRLCGAITRKFTVYTQSAMKINFRVRFTYISNLWSRILCKHCHLFPQLGQQDFYLPSASSVSNALYDLCACSTRTCSRIRLQSKGFRHMRKTRTILCRRSRCQQGTHLQSTRLTDSSFTN